MNYDNCFGAVTFKLYITENFRAVLVLPPFHVKQIRFARIPKHFAFHLEIWYRGGNLNAFEYFWVQRLAVGGCHTCESNGLSFPDKSAVNPSILRRVGEMEDGVGLGAIHDKSLASGAWYEKLKANDRLLMNGRIVKLCFSSSSSSLWITGKNSSKDCLSQTLRGPNRYWTTNHISPDSGPWTPKCKLHNVQ